MNTVYPSATQDSWERPMRAWHASMQQPHRTHPGHAYPAHAHACNQHQYPQTHHDHNHINHNQNPHFDYAHNRNLNSDYNYHGNPSPDLDYSHYPPYYYRHTPAPAYAGDNHDHLLNPIPHYGAPPDQGIASSHHLNSDYNRPDAVATTEVAASARHVSVWTWSRIRSVAAAFA